MHQQNGASEGAVKYILDSHFALGQTWGSVFETEDLLPDSEEENCWTATLFTLSVTSHTQ